MAYSEKSSLNIFNSYFNVMSISDYISTKFTSLTTSVNVADELTVAPSLAIQ